MSRRGRQPAEIASAQEFRSGFVALVGRPNVGKSTLLNALVGERVAIATPRPQTTRTRIRGVVHRPGCQIVFVDTPGIHTRDWQLNRFMLGEARAALGEVDLAVLLVEARGRGSRPDEDEEDRLVLELLAAARVPALLAINKVDTLPDKGRLLPLMQAYATLGRFEELIPVSALRQEGLEPLLLAIEARLKEGPAYFPPELYTDQSERLMVAELVREAAMLRTEDEIPYSLAVHVDAFDEQPGRGLVRILATVYVERDSQKGILIGKGGRQLKEIGSAARKAIEDLLGCKVFLGLTVKVAPDWSRTLGGLRKVGYEP
jgi:GTPase